MAAKKAPSKAARATRSRANLNQDFDAVRASHEGQEAQDSVAAAAKAQRSALVRSATENLSVEQVVNRLNATKLEASRALDRVNEELTTQTEELQQVREAVQLEQQELAELHGREVVATSITALIKDYDVKQAELETSYNQKSAAQDLILNEKQKAFEVHMLTQKTNWQREQEAYNYAQQQQRRDVDDAWQEKLRQRKIEEEDHLRQRNLGWEQREQALKTREAELVSLQQQVAAFPTELGSQLTKVDATARSQVTREWQHKVEILQAQYAADAKVAESEKKSLQQSNDALARSVLDLNSQVRSLQEQLKDISSSALQVASGQAALGAVQQTVKDGVGKPKSSS